MKAGSESQAEWSLIITPSRKWWEVNWVELWRYRDLIILFVRRDFVAYYKQTILGPLWFFLQPIMTTVVFTVIFGKVAGMSTDGKPQVLFYLSGLIAWNYFAACLNGTANVFVTNAHVFGKVYFPRLCVPLGVVFSNMLQFFIQFSLYVIWFIYYVVFRGIHFQPHWQIIFLPLVLLQMAFLGLGCGILVSSLTTKYRDLALAVTFGVQLWFYLTPVVYDIEKMSSEFRWWSSFNPMSSIIQFFRFVLLDSGHINWEHSLIGLAVTSLLVAVGLIAFNQVEKTFMDTV